MIDIKQNVIVSVKVDGRDAARQLGDVDRALNTVNLDAAKLESGFKRLAREAVTDLEGALGKLKGGLGSAFDGIDRLSKGLAPMNQALELGKKVLGAAEAGLDAYAKTSAGAAKQVKEIEDRFRGYKESVSAAVGAVTVAILDQSISIDNLNKKMLELGNNDTFKKFYDSNGKVRSIEDLAKGAGLDVNSLIEKGYLKRVSKNEGDPFGALADSFTALKKSGTDLIKESGDHWDPSLRILIDDFEKLGKTSKKSTEEVGAFQYTLKQLQITQEKQIQVPTKGPRFASNYGAAVDEATSVGASQLDITGLENDRTKALTEDWNKRLEFAQGRNKSLMESVFGPIDDLSAYKEQIEAMGMSLDEFHLQTLEFEALGNVFSAFTDAVGAGYEAIVTGQGSVSAAFKKMAADSLMAMGKESAIAALKETALGFGSLALGPIGGVSAAAHFKSAALHAGVAVAAGVAAGALGAGSGGSAGGTGGSSAPSGGGGRGGTEIIDTTGGTGRRAEKNNNIVVVYADPFAEGSPGVRRRNAQKVIARARGGRDWNDS